MNHAWSEERIVSHLIAGRRLYDVFIKGDRDRTIPPPRFISCWVSEVCNLDCTYCYFSDTNHDKSHQFIDANQFLRWLAEARRAGTEALEFSGGGEPTLHPRFAEIYTLAHDMGYKLGIITHACNTMPLYDMSKKFKYIRCGLDAATPETHDAIKRNKRKNYWFHRAIENIREMVTLRESKEDKDFTVGIKVVLNSINFEELGAMIDLARELSVDYIQIKQEHSSDHALTAGQAAQAQSLINIRASENAMNRTQVKGTMTHARATVKCFMSPIHTVVTATGKVLQCCFFENRPIGTIFQPFWDVWGGEDHRKVVEMTTINECDKIDCRWNLFNKRMQEIIEDPLSQMSFI